MFLFSKRTRNVIKYLWGVFAVLIILSMVFAYSGFTSLTSAPSPTAQTENLPPEAYEALEQAQANLATSSTATTTHEDTPMSDTPIVPVTEQLPPPPPPLDFSI